jgi:hypothetical protein
MSMSNEAREGTASALCCEIDGVQVPVLTEDLSVAGLFVETKTPLAMDREVEIYVQSPMGELSARGQVVQVVNAARAKKENRRPGFGLLFTSLSDDQRAFIGLTLDALLRARKAAMERAKAKAAARSSKPQVDPEKAALAQTVCDELRKLLARLQGKPPWSVLGLEQGVSPDAAKLAFLELSKHCHPHKYARYDSADVTRLATELFIVYKRAYSVLTKLAPRELDRISDITGSGARRLVVTSIVPASSAESTPSKPAGAAKRSH